MEGNGITKKSLAAAVVLYNSEDKVLYNIQTYLTQVDKVFVINNSEVENLHLVSSITANINVEYYWMEGNKGIAAALNVAARLSIKKGYNYLLMMDDDSQLIKGTIKQMLYYINNYNDEAEIGIIAPKVDPNVDDRSIKSVWHCITSGSLLNLSAYEESGPFMEELFIDGVDHEYCYRLKQRNYKIVILNYIFMPHRMGLPEEIRVFNRVIYKWSSHHPIRNYYMIRNFFYIIKVYEKILPAHIRLEIYYGLLKACCLDLLFGVEKYTRFRYIFKAFLDYKKNKLGQFEDRV